ncbi:PIR protein [Plasmodium brasilianum]|uniref:PIR protein n=1 Tax=Plasmodium brasilianum TaxID=5824 RepID=A0ACB9YF06_PLABR|nr:PIR protein [Plasmodium brasilianum]
MPCIMQDKALSAKSQLHSYIDIKSVEDDILKAFCFINFFSSEDNACKEQCKFLGDVKEEEFKKMKIVHNYCKYYETIKQNLSMNGNLCYSVFENYLEEAVKIYDKMLHNCNFRNPEKYCAEFRNHVSDCFSKKLPTLMCKKREFTTLASWIRTNLVTKKLTSSNSDDTDRYELIEE